MATKRFPSTAFPTSRHRSKLTRRKSAFRRADLERLEDRQLLAVVGAPAAELGGPADGYLDRLYEQWQAHQASGSSEGFSPSFSSLYQISGDSIAVQIYAPGDTPAVASDLASLGLMSGRYSDEHIAGRVDFADLPAVTSASGVRYVSPAFAPSFNQGSVQSQGDAAIRANEVRNDLNFDGSGVTVGVISDSFDVNEDVSTSAADDIASGDLPGDQLGDNPRLNILQDAGSTSGFTDDEGRAMAQVIYDVAPGAGLLFHSVQHGGFDDADEASMVNAITALSDNGADVIVDDVFFPQEPFFQDGIVAQKIDEVVNQSPNPITYISAASNSGDNSYEASFSDSSVTADGQLGNTNGAADTWHNFDSTGGTALLQDITIPEGASVTIVLQHAEAFSSIGGGSGQTNDINFVLVDPTIMVDPGEPDGGAFNPSDPNNDGSTSPGVHPGIVAQANTNIDTTVSNPGAAQDPLEIIPFTNTSSTNTHYQIGILRSGDSTGSPLMKYVIHLDEGVQRPSIDTFATNSSTLVGHANAAGAIAVGAAFYANTPAINGGDPAQVSDYSSKGGTQIRFDTNGNALATPEDRSLSVVGPDGVHTTFFGQFDPETDGTDNFFGTSAAAAHVAGVVALMLDADASQTPAENRSILESTSSDILERIVPETDTVVMPGASAGFDDYSGFGFVDARRAVEESIGVPSIDLDTNDGTASFDTTASFDEQAGTPVIIAGPVGITDSDDTELTGATVEITNNLDSPNEILAVTDSGGITSSYDATAGILTLSGTASLTDYETVLNTLTYDNNENNPDATTRIVEVTVSDGSNFTTSTSLVSIVIFDDPPVAVDDSDTGIYTTNEDSDLVIAAPGVLSNDTDPEGGSLTAILEDMPTNGSVSLASDGSFTYTPNSNYNGPDSFTYRANDGNLSSTAVATVSINVTAVNDPPVVNPDDYAVDEDQTLTVTPANQGVLTNDSDVDGDDLTVALSGGQPANGTVSLAADGTFTYTPDMNFFSEDTFQYTVSDGTVTSAPALVTIAVAPVNDGPTATADTINATEDTDFNGTLAGTDPEDDPLTFAIDTDVPASEGTVNITDANTGAFTFTPASNFNGTTSFTFTVDDTDLTSAPATIMIDVAAVNDAPTAADDSLSTMEDTPLSETLTGDDVDGDSFTFSIASQPSAAEGSVVLDDPNTGAFTFTPAANFNGSTSFTFTTEDTNGATSTAATIDIDVTAVNDVPIANGASFGTPEDTPLNETLTGTDVEGSPLTFAIATGVPAAAGTVSITDNMSGDFTFTPADNFSGSTSFTFTVNDGTDTSAAATVNILVSSDNDQPVANSDTASTMEDVTLNGTLTATDDDGDMLTFDILAPMPASQGTVSTTEDGDYTFIPAANFSGSTSFTFTANDGFIDSAPATIDITVTAVNDPPVADDDTISTDEDTPVTFDPRGNDSDVEDDSLTITGVTQGSSGSVSNTGTTLTYTPALNFSGTDSFTYTISDGNGGTDTAMVMVTVNPQNDAPVFTSTPIVMAQENTPYSYTITTNDIDNPGTDLTINASTVPSWLTFNDNGDGTATLTGTPMFADIGMHSVNLTVTDPASASGSQNFTIEVLADNVPPTAVDDGFMIDEDDTNVTLDVLVNDTFAPDTGETLTITSVSGVGLGHSVNITGSPGSQTLTYTPPADFSGTEIFTYTITDGTSPDSTDVASVTVIVEEVNDPPTANDDTFFGITEDSVDNPLDVLANDSIAPDSGETLDIASLTTPDSGGTVTVNDNGTPGDTSDDFVDYTPAVGFRGTETFMYTIADGRGGTDTATVNIAVFNQPVFQVASTGDVFAIGSDDSDRIIFSKANSFNGVLVRYNNVFYGPFILQADSTLNADGRGGNDSIIVAGNLDRVSNLNGGVSNDYLASNSADDTLSGGDGNDVMLAGEGDNLLFGGDGNDRMQGRTGDDTFDGGAGTDRINGNSGNDTIHGGDGNDAITGSLGDDLLFGDEGSDLLTGDYGNDVLVGGDASDTLFGRSGNDVLIGSTGSDRLRGSNGDDLLLGGSSDYDNNEAALLAILAEWTSGNDIDTRIMNISSGSTTGGNPLSISAGTTDDGTIDDLTGDSGVDWFIAFSDGIRDQRDGDVVDR